MLENMLKASNVFTFLIDMLGKANIEFENEVNDLKMQRKRDKKEIKEKLALLYVKEKQCCVSENLMVCIFKSRIN